MSHTIPALLAVLSFWMVPPGQPSATNSLPGVSAGPRPGPDVLYAGPARARQLENTGIWKASPIMVSGVDAYKDGEYLYQDFVYDDYGANSTEGAEDPQPVPATIDVLFGAMTGDVVYPTDADAYVDNAADLLEFRARLVPGGVAYRITLNSMTASTLAGVAIGIDSDRDVATGTDDWGFGIGSLGPLGLDKVVTSWGTGSSSGSSTVHLMRRQIELRVPSTPRRATWRHYLVVGLFDEAAGAFKSIADLPTGTQPGGAHGKDVPPVFNVGFRFREPMGIVDKTRNGEIEEADTGARSPPGGFGHWREHGQAKALAVRDISAFHADIDFGKLADGTDESHVPSAGYLNRLYASRLNLGQGRSPIRPMLRGQIQPYSAYVPHAKPSGGYPLTLALHARSCTYNQYAVMMPRLLTQLGEERGAILLTTADRGPDGFYHDEAEVDLFEAWADLARRYDLNSDRVTVSGYSMGGYATYKLASQYPDLFATGFSVVGPVGEAFPNTFGLTEDKHNTLSILDGLRNVPLLMWNGLIDELDHVSVTMQIEKRLSELGYRYELDLFPAYDHFLFYIVDEWGAAKSHLASDRVDRNPFHVVYRAMPEMDNASLGLVHDHAYWVDDIVVASDSRSGLVDVRSMGRGEAEPRQQLIAGLGLDPSPHFRKGTSWGARPIVPARNRVEVLLDAVASVTLWVERAGIDMNEPVEVSVTSSGPATVTIATDHGKVRLKVRAGASEHSVRL